MSVVTNTTPTVAYRGAGRPEAAAAIERIMDVFADEIGMDPAEVRRRNLIANDRFPFTTPDGIDLRHRRLRGRARPGPRGGGLRALRAEQAGAGGPAADPVQIGIGVSTYVEVTGGAGPPGEFAPVEVLPDGRRRVNTGTLAPRPGPRDRVDDARSRPDRHPDGPHRGRRTATPTWCPGARAPWARARCSTAALAVHQATERLVERATELAADLLEASRRRRRRRHGRRAVPRGRARRRRSRRGRSSPSRRDRRAAASSSSRPARPGGPTYPFGAHVAVVEVDTETGKVVVKRLIAVDDAGRSSTRCWSRARSTAGWPRGIAQALLEEVRYDAGRQPRSPPTSPTTPSSRPPSCPSFETRRAWRRRPRSTPSAPRASASPAASGRPRRCRTRSSTPCPTSACGTSTCPPHPERVWAAIAGGHQVKVQHHRQRS